MSIQEKYSKFIKEILFIVTLSVALFLLFCLVSYSKGLLALPAVYQEPVDNWCGVIGHYLARYSLSFLGMASFCPIIILVYSSISFLRKNETLDRLPFLVAGITGTTISIATLLAVMEVNIFLDGTILPGGYVGFLLNNILIGFIGTAGSILLCFTLLLFSLMAAVRFSPYEFTLWVTQFFSSLVIYIHRKTGALCRDCFEIVKEKAGSPPLLSGAVRGRQLGRNVRFIDVPLENEKVVYDEPEVPIYTNIETQSVGVNLETTSDQVIHQSYETRDVETENQEDEQEEVEIQTVGSEIEEEKTKPLIYHTFEQEYHENDIENDREDNIIPVINQAPERQPEESIKKPEIAPEVVQVAKSKEEPVSEQPQQPVIHRQPSTGEEVAPAQESLSQQRVPASQQQTPEVQEQASVVQQQGSVSPHQPSVPSQQVPAVHEAVKVEKVSTSQGNDEERTFSSGQFVLPPISLLDPHKDSAGVDIDKEHFFKISKILERKLLDFNVKGNVVGISPGPVVTTYEYSPAPGVKINKIMSLADDLAMVLKVERVRVMGSIPGKAAVGIEIPNPVRKTVFLREILESQAYSNSESRLSLAMGLDSVGQAVIADLTKMPHLLIAGATGAGKSVAINAFIASMLYKSTPEEVRLLMIDPKRIELSVYEDIPHLLHPVVVEPKMASR
ncbi:MAG: DNA translocase FtsK 4TM domain-containing protein, partial [Desulfobulbaceae bacterium]|nr:DNA translocase FtsK 4TM domain-containing protein [Desulfobulbaceae bacterium]